MGVSLWENSWDEVLDFSEIGSLQGWSGGLGGGKIAKVNDFEQSGFHLAKILARGGVFPYGRIPRTKSWTLAKFGPLQGWWGGPGGGKIAKVNDFEQSGFHLAKILAREGAFSYERILGTKS